MIQENKIKPIKNTIKQFALQTNHAKLTSDSLAWFRKFVTKNLARVNPAMLMSTGIHTLRPKPGFLYSYQYDPKYKDSLPYYDTYPLILCLDVYKDGWSGINVHYMPPKIRQVIFEHLAKTLNNDAYDETTKFKINWAKLKAFTQNKYIAHACKRYLTNHLKTPMVKIDPEFWETVIFMPVARFEKATAREVWRGV